MGGRAATIITAEAMPHWMPPPLAAKKKEAPTVIGTAWLVVSSSPNKNSFHAVMKPKIRVVAQRRADDRRE